MPLYKYVGNYERFYGGIKAADGRDLSVKTGDVADLESAPDYEWVRVDPDPAPVPDPVNPAAMPPAVA